MTPQEWIARVRARADALRTSSPLFFATTSTMAEVEQRVWGRGQLTNGGTIKYKEDYQVWAYTPPSPRKVTGKGKPNAAGQRRNIKGGWYPTYLAYKEQQGRRELPFELTGDMRIAWLGGPVPTPRVSGDGLLCEIVMPAEEYAKVEGLEKSKGAFLELTQAEKDFQAQRLEQLISEALR
jgi:hypothetical protein